MLDARGSADVHENKLKSRTRNTRGRTSSASASPKPSGKALTIEPLLNNNNDPFEQVEWDTRSASITDDHGGVIFSQDNIEVPSSWSMLATTVVASKYFYGGVGTDEREHSLRQIIHRVARTITDWGMEGGYFASETDAETYYGELAHACLNQYGSFNSPVWFNVGLHQIYGHSADSLSSYSWSPEEQVITRVSDSYEHPQASACFIQAVDDTMEDIMRLATQEAMLFKHGSGTGTDLSTLRSSREKLSGGGTPSGPLSFMRVYDQIAAVIKSGGKTRRAAKMQSLKIHHPDIIDFINCKKREEQKAWALIDQGYDGSFGGEAYESVMYQNANLSIRVTDDFMQAVEDDNTFDTRAVVTGDPLDTHSARDVMKQIADATHLCGDPGVQYDDTINKWHTCLKDGRINASNPCSEFMFLDDSACNLASINLMKFVDDTGNFDVDKFKHVVRLYIIAQDILVDSASYPSEEIAQKSHLYRPLGLGYANLGALVMRLGMPYDSDEGRAFAGIVTALMTGQAYATSQELAQNIGTFDRYEHNKECMLRVLDQHKDSLLDIRTDLCPTTLTRAAAQVWEQVIETAPSTGFRNSQVTLLAPTGTIGFMMDCDTTGVEPDIALIKYKQLAGGGSMKIVNRTVKPALVRLRYTDDQVESILNYVDERETVEGAPGLNPDHLSVFDCAYKPVNGERFIPYNAHLKMMAAVQPFLSGAISKTVNIPSEATSEEIMQTYIEGWKMGLKAVAVYRDGSKRTQPVNTSQQEDKDTSVSMEKVDEARRAPFRKRMPATRHSLTHKFEVAGHEGYLTVGIYDDGAPGELFITMAKEGSTVGGTMDSFGTAISLCLQYGVPVQELCKKFAHSRFEPSGFTKNPDIPIAKSIVDYIFRWLDVTFPNGKTFIPGAQKPEGDDKPAKEDAPTQPMARTPEPARKTADGSAPQRVDEQFTHFMEDAPACDICGAITVRNGACYRCYNCGNSMGCS